mmetsp:Transcript_15257/g.23099  ORF Transcript_15257/g.23099 Transcript_15257/m.23099 type:complete len:837 (-) Transcript_15257:172-2682(-)
MDVNYRSQSVPLDDDGGIDIHAGLEYLFTTQHKGVREYILEKLDAVPEEDIEFYLPQLCHLVSNIPAADGIGIIEFIADRCAKSAHICLKTILTIQSAVYYASTKEQKQKYTELWRCSESAYLHAKRASIRMSRSRSCYPKFFNDVPHTTLRSKSSLYELVREDHFSEKKKKAAIAEASTAEGKKILATVENKSNTKTTVEAAIEEIKKNEGNYSSPAVKETPTETQNDQFKKPSGPTATSSSISRTLPAPIGVPKSNDESTECKENKEVKSNVNTSEAKPSKSKVSHSISSTPPNRALRKLSSKPILNRQTFLESESKLLADLNHISEMLVKKVKRKNRTQALKACLQKLNQRIPDGIYLPYGMGNGKHYMIRGFVPDAARALNSRDKAPYMLFIEILYTGKKFSDPNIHVCVTPSSTSDSKAKVKSNSSSEIPDLQAITEALKKQYGLKFSGTDLMKTLKSYSEIIVAKKLSSSTEMGKADVELLSRQLASNLLASGVVTRENKAKSPLPTREELTVTPRDVYCIEGKASAEKNQERKMASKSARVNPFGRAWKEKKAKIRSESKFGKNPNWDLISVIFKGGDDLRQEVLAMQLIKMCDKIFHDAGLPLQLSPYEVMVTAPESGLIETIHDATSIDALKGDVPNFVSLADFFEDFFGQRGSQRHEQAQRNFVESMAAYSLVTYLFAIKDRHNGNIMMDREGRIIHIDFGFMLNNSPGGNSNFESSPFKLTQEYVEVMEGEDSKAFAYFKLMFIRGLLELRKHYKRFELTVRMMMDNSNMACFAPTSIEDMKERFGLKLEDGPCIEFANTLVETSINNWRSVQYDEYQRITNGIR